MLAFPHRCDALAMANILADQVRLGTTKAVCLGMGMFHLQLGSVEARSVQHTGPTPPEDDLSKCLRWLHEDLSKCLRRLHEVAAASYCRLDVAVS